MEWIYCPSTSSWQVNLEAELDLDIGVMYLTDFKERLGIENMIVIISNKNEQEKIIDKMMKRNIIIIVNRDSCLSTGERLVFPRLTF